MTVSSQSLHFSCLHLSQYPFHHSGLCCLLTPRAWCPSGLCSLTPQDWCPSILCCLLTPQAWCPSGLCCLLTQRVWCPSILSCLLTPRARCLSGLLRCLLTQRVCCLYGVCCSSSHKLGAPLESVASFLDTGAPLDFAASSLHELGALWTRLPPHSTSLVPLWTLLPHSTSLVSLWSLLPTHSIRLVPLVPPVAHSPTPPPTHRSQDTSS